MTPWDLQKALIAEIEKLLAEMQMKNATGEDVAGVKGYEQRLPEITDDEEDQSQFFPILLCESKKATHRRTMSHGSSEPTVLFGKFVTTTKKRTDTEPSWR